MVRSAILTLCALTLFAVPPAWSQIEVTAPGTGRLFADALLYNGKRIENGMARNAAVDLLGEVKVVGKPELTSSTKLASQMGLINSTIADRITLKCGVCWLEIIEKRLEKNEAISVIMMGAERGELRVALLVLNKTANKYGRTLDDVWEGSRDIYLGTVAFRLTQDRTGLSLKPLDLNTGNPVEPDPGSTPTPADIKRRLRSLIA